jgi:hypothetical protein
LFFINGNINSRTKLSANGTVAQNEYNLFREKINPIENKYNKLIREIYTISKTQIKKILDVFYLKSCSNP